MPKKLAPLSINLLPGREVAIGEKFLRWILTYGRYIIIGTEIIVLLAFLSRFKLDRDFSDLNDRIEERQRVIENFRSIEDTVNQLQARLSQIKTIEAAQGSGLLALPNIALLTPTEITYKNITIAGNKVTIVGTASETADTSHFVAQLKASNLFKKDSVVLEKIERAKPQDSFLTFTITGVVEREKT